jgi:signal transduction histidine kinase
MKELFLPFSSFRARMVIFMAAMSVVTTAALYSINQRLEARIRDQLNRHLHDLTLAINIGYSSLPRDRYLYTFIQQGEFIRPDGNERLSITPHSIVRHILVIDEQGKIKDSTERDEIDKPLPIAIGNLPQMDIMDIGDVMRDADASGSDQELTMTYPALTEKGEHKIIIVVSMSQLNRVVREASRDRLIAMGVLGLLMILIIAVVSWRFTRPITVLARAANRVKAGDVDFQVPVAQRDEIGALAATFNEMLAGLRSKRELEEELQRAERSAVVGRLASGIAHEIRNPLNFINLSIDHLREKFAPPVDGARAEFTRILGTIKDEIGRLNRLVSDFLSYGRPAQLKLAETSARSLIEEVIGLVSAQAEQQGVRIMVQEAGDQSNHLRADAKQLKTCFSNLVINAIQAMPGGGQLAIALRQRGPDLRIEFADTGLGIAPEAIENIFEPYYSTKETGIGLGLPLTKKIIEEHGGQITVASELGAGTTFTVTLPREPNGREQSAAQPSEVVQPTLVK